jgi:hypothetical protein
MPQDIVQLTCDTRPLTFHPLKSDKHRKVEVEKLELVR